ncbi:hypothetical protein [Roseibium alexandrii]|uniref:DUF4261 domain-containing protein n=1 Tax=Roseibium alexandrii (strain DSM 17067 / NCIMB 14079 / DFL-11) TaxID=244592 RepID=A0A5E8H0X6_ROSAD|nr:hypothetical protein [Roseibium alexandrii]EEE45659.1 hypothetical protein SADFL11_2948 [Roseibium alexandrii DFL-11]
MKIFPTPSIDAQVLMERYEPLSGNAVLEMIVRAAVAAGLPAEECKLLKTSTEKDIRVLCGNYHILVTQTVPFEASAQLEKALNSFSVKSSFPEAADVIEATTAYTQISVYKGLIPVDAFPDGALQEIGENVATFTDSSESHMAMAIVKSVTASIANASPPTAIFWMPSLFLMTPDTFKLVADEDTPLLLYVHPHLYGEKSPLTGEQLIGVIGSGAPSIIGYSVEFTPSKLPTGYLIERLYSFIGFTLKRGKVFPSGDVFGSDENEKIQVFHHPPQDGGAPRIELKVVHNPALGVERDPVPTIFKEYDTEGALKGERIDGAEEVVLDPDDPIDAAILQQLNRQKTGETPPATLANRVKPIRRPPAASSPEASQPGTQPRRPRVVSDETAGGASEAGPRKRSSMDELRQIAIAAQQANASDKPSKGGGFLGRFLKRK